MTDPQNTTGGLPRPTVPTLPHQFTVTHPGDYTVFVSARDCTRTVVWLDAAPRAAMNCYRSPGPQDWFTVLPDLQPGQVIGMETDSPDAELAVHPLDDGPAAAALPYPGIAVAVCSPPRAR